MNFDAGFRKIATSSARLVLRKPLAVIVAVGLLAVAATLFALRIDADTGVESITGDSSDAYVATQKWAKQFGGDPIVVLVKGQKDGLPRIVLGPDLAILGGLEGCLSGNIPPAARVQADTPQVCKRLAELKPAVAVYGPGTFVTTAAASVNEGIGKILAKAKKTGDEAAAAAREIARRQGKTIEEQEAAAKAAQDLADLQATRDALILGQEYGLGLGNLPSIDNAAFVAQLIFDPEKGSKEPKSRFQYLFPSSESALIQMRLRPDLTPAERAETVDLVKRAVANGKFQLSNGAYTVTGAPVVMTGSQDAIERAVVVLLIGALIVMALVLLVVFPAELRLLPLALALMTAGLTYGLLALTGSRLGVGAVAVLPVLVGLSVDYSIQFHARADKAMRGGAAPDAAVRHAAGSGGPPVLAAALATVAALLALALSPVPLVRGFGLLLVAGVAIAIAVVLTAGFATLGWAGGAGGKGERRQPAMRVAALLRLRRSFAAVTRQPARALAVATVLAVCGWAAALFSPVSTDVTQLVPRGSQAAKDIKLLQETTGAAGTIDVLVRAKNVTDPKVIEWMRDYQTRVLAEAGYKGESPRCERAKLCPALSLTDVFENQKLTKQRIRALLATVGDFSRGVVSPGRKMATIAFGVRLESLDDQAEVISMLRDELDPPPGVQADVVGLTALAADASSSLGNPLRRLAISGAALLLFLLVAFAVTGRLRRALPPVVSVALAAGVSSLLLWVLRIDLNPMSAALSVFVIAIAGEFTLLIYLQYLRNHARDAALGIADAYRVAYRTIGPAVFASGVTALAGFAVLAISDIGMLRGFALVAVIDLAVALAGTVLLLPAVTLIVEIAPTAADGVGLPAPEPAGEQSDLESVPDLPATS
ncbi:MAG: MMPL family transporter [Actinobacteria bacterium]|nr:MMPL family transporter [Actinomycetota bacterium]